MVDALRPQQAVPAAVGRTATNGYVDWPAIIVGTVLATAVAFVLNTFGAAIGLSVMSPFERDGGVGTGFLIAVGLWIMWVTVSSVMVGAYVAGRMRKRAQDATSHEGEVRDGVHGVTVWAASLLLTGFIVASGLDTAARSGAEAISGGGGQGMTDGGTGAAEDYALNKLLRLPPEAAASAPQGQAAEGRQALLDEFGAILAATTLRGDGDIAADDKAYMTASIAARTGLDEQQATARVEELAASYRQTLVAAQEAAEAARVASVVSAFLLAASLLIAAAGAWWAAGTGGTHRDEETVLSFFGRRA